MNHFSQQLNMSHISQCKPLGSRVLGSAENGTKTFKKTVPYKEGVDPYFVLKGFGVETPSTSEIDAELVRHIVRIERREG